MQVGGRFFTAEDLVTFVGEVDDAMTVPYTLVMDNCAVHKAKVVQELLAQREIDVVFTVAYTPTTNMPVETAFGVLKAKFRAKLRDLLAADMPTPVAPLVRQCLEELTDEGVKRNCLKYNNTFL